MDVRVVVQVVVAERVDDLMKTMTLEEKAGLMVSPTLPMGPDGTVSDDPRASPANPFGGGSAQAGTTNRIAGCSASGSPSTPATINAIATILIAFMFAPTASSCRWSGRVTAVYMPAFTIVCPGSR